MEPGGNQEVMITAQSTLPGVSRFLSRAISHNLTAYVVPGMEVARAYQLDLKNSGLILTDVPRQANVLVLIGAISDPLRQQALTLYQQMIAPKAILSVGTTGIDPLPTPDVVADFNAQSIQQSVKKLQELFKKNAFGKIGTQLFTSNHSAYQGHDMQSMAGMDHGPEDLGFMSMVMMTDNLPKSPDGLPMEWGEMHFGPLFAGLPGGLETTFLLDGDSIAQTEVSVDSVKRNLDSKWLGNVSNFLNAFSLIDPLLPQTYRILAELGLENALKKPADEKTKVERTLTLEKERATSHLNWLASFASLLHFSSLKEETENHLRELQNIQTADGYKRIQTDIERFTTKINNHWLLKKRLSGIGVIGTTDAFTRMVTTLSEVNQSLAILTGNSRGAENRIDHKVNLQDNFPGSSHVTLKTPRGQAGLSIKQQNGKILAVSLTTPSTQKIALIPGLVQNMEVGDALIAVASLNISPWEAAL